MAALDFPATPTVGQKYPVPAVVGVPVYTWDGEKWTTIGGAIGSTGGADDPPLADGTATAGVSTQWAREDHVHPRDTTSFASEMAYSGMQINGSHDVNQEGIANLAVGGYIVDGWSWAKNSTATLLAVPTSGTGFIPGFDNYITVNVNTAGTATPAAGEYVFLKQPIEGYRVARLQWGTANASPLTIAFWSGHQVTGVFGIALQNSLSIVLMLRPTLSPWRPSLNTTSLQFRATQPALG